VTSPNRFILTVVLTCAALRAQATFECYGPGPFPLPGPLNCEALLCNNLGLTGTTGITATAACGFPTQGSQYARVEGSGPFASPPGGPPPYPLPVNVTELRIPIPPGSSTVQLCWDFYNAEGAGSFLNDGMAISVVDALGGLVQLLAYADASSSPGVCADTLTYLSTEVQPNGPQGLSAPLPALAGGEYLSISCWNGFDNFVPSHVKLDDVRFNSGPPSCPTPPPPPSNDQCAGALPLILGANGPYANVSATTGGPPSTCAPGPDLNDLWFQFTPVCGGAYTIDTCGASFNTTLSVWDACGGTLIACNDDDPTATCPSPTSSRLLFPSGAGVRHYVRVSGPATGASTGTFNLNVTQVFLFSFLSAGPGTAGFQISGGPPGGLYFAAITLNQGAFPNGAFFGVDIGLDELASLFASGPPFTGSFGTCGDVTFGPVGGLPSGLAAFGTALAFPGPIYWIPTASSVLPASIIVP
jgi:hypothetical protein